ncbi:cuticle protein [Culex quinquefasciatus]|uniref:Cuticle protein n=3 Tax=Culex pipiens complex TaxID=518105 RepID=B0WRC4_CULQU|nr:cuticle protein CP14.6 [Culex quinquefasciatus]XP_039438629.1 cuticle protein CP14.6-like [Culex pipiens pallens]EDS33314.1 cuticle protein [Culex quinquefasciatus]|eukprot:XP_001851258.1 cuticle protein [Culex quinquefasciatus]
MKLYVAVLVLAAVAHAAPQGQSDADTPILSQSSDIQPDGSFSYAFETGNGIKVEDQGTIKRVRVPKTDETGRTIGEDEIPVAVQTGSFQYMAPDGQIYTLRYIADENGFQPQADHLPVAPLA